MGPFRGILAGIGRGWARLTFAVRRFFARRAFAFRERRRNRKLFPYRWHTIAQLAAADIALFREVDGDVSINEKLLDRLVDARAEILSNTRRWSLATLLLTAYLLLASFSIDLPVTVEGIGLKSTPGLREVATLLIALIGLLLLSRTVSVHHINVAINGLENVLFPPELKPFIHAAHFPTEPPPHYTTKMQPQLIWAPAFIRFSFVYGVFWFLIFIGGLVALVWARVTIYLFVWANPTIDPGVTKLLVALAAGIDLATFVAVLSHLVPFPLRDWSKLEALEIARQTNPQTHALLLAEYYGEGDRDLLAMRSKGYMAEDEFDTRGGRSR